MLAVEYDGAEWHTSPEDQQHDRARRNEVRGEGWLVGVFTSKNVFGQNDRRLNELHRKARQRPTAP